MPHIHVPMAVCAVAAGVLRGSHDSLNLLFEAAGVPGPPPEASHATKWKLWLFREANKPEADGLAMLGHLIGEFMDVEPVKSSPESDTWQQQRDQLQSTLEKFGLRYFPGGRVLPNGQVPLEPFPTPPIEVRQPAGVEEVLQKVICGLPRAMYPLTNRRKGAQPLSFGQEWDLQDLLHAMLRPWIRDIRAEEHTPSYGGKSTRMDFLLPEHKLVLELKLIRDVAHGRTVGDELIAVMEHYRQHPRCDRLWCVIYDPGHHLANPMGLINDVQGRRSGPKGVLDVKVLIIPQPVT